MKRTLIKLLIATTLLVSLILLSFTHIDGGIKAVSDVILVVIVGPSVLLWGIDLSRAIRREAVSSQSMRTIGRILAIPQLLFGVILVAWGAAYPAVFGIPEIVSRLSQGASAFHPAIYTILAGLMFSAGIWYLRDGLGLMRYQKPETKE